MITIVFFLALLALRDLALENSPVIGLLWSYGGAFLVTVTVALTLFSGFAYLWKNRVLLSP
jgi:phosphatidylglycerophosphate synthase